MDLWLKYLLAGPLCFWGPEVLAAFVFQTSKEDHVFLINAILVLSLCCGYFALLRPERQNRARPSIAGAMLVGIYVFGPSLMMLEGTAEGAGVHTFKTASDWLYLPIFSVMPPYTLIMSGYDLSFFALLTVTLFLVVAHAKWERGLWILPSRRRLKAVQATTIKTSS